MQLSSGLASRREPIRTHHCTCASQAGTSLRSRAVAWPALSMTLQCISWHCANATSHRRTLGSIGQLRAAEQWSIQPRALQRITGQLLWASDCVQAHATLPLGTVASPTSHAPVTLLLPPATGRFCWNRAGSPESTMGTPRLSRDCTPPACCGRLGEAHWLA